MLTYQGDLFDANSYGGDALAGRPKYFPEPELVKAVNLAILLRKPLLVMGDPGCGKSKLAEAIAREWYPDPVEYETRYARWNIKSGSKLADGQYTMDNLRRLRDATFKENQALVDDVQEYITYGPLHKAFTIDTLDKPGVLLIDEIDKADIDFPNDLLHELEEFRFRIPELKKDIIAKSRPIIIITSNKEKDLPDAFLRRCVYHYIKPLSPQKLKEIVLDRFYRQGPGNYEPLIDKAIEKFVELRDKINKDILQIGKNISTSEFIDWYQALQHYSETHEDDKATASLVSDLKAYFTEDGFKEIPFGNLLFKTEKSLVQFAPKAVQS
jgi:MoxR-like ATPase